MRASSFVCRPNPGGSTDFRFTHGRPSLSNTNSCPRSLPVIVVVSVYRPSFPHSLVTPLLPFGFVVFGPNFALPPQHTAGPPKANITCLRTSPPGPIRRLTFEPRPRTTVTGAGKLRDRWRVDWHLRPNNEAACQALDNKSIHLTAGWHTTTNVSRQCRA